MSITRNLSVSTTYRRRFQRGGFYSLDVVLPLDLVGSRTCQSVPGWREIIRNGGAAIGPYSLDASKIEVFKPGSVSLSTNSLAVPFPPGTPNAVTSEGFSGFATNLGPPPVNNVTSALKADSIALSKAYRKIKSEQEHLNSLASLAEFGDVLRQFGSPLQAIVDLSNKRLNRLELERRGLKGSIAFKRAKWLKIVASTWLEYSFGLAPLISDTKKVAEALAQFNNDEEVSRLLAKKKIVARGKDESSNVSSTTSQVDSSYFRVRRVSKDTYESRCQYVVGLKATRTADFGSNDRLLELLGVNQANLLPAAWEALPWSWLIDYFSNVGNILEAAATSTAGVTWICKTTTSRTVRETLENLDYAETLKAVTAQSRKIVGSSSTEGSCRVVRTVLNRQQVSTLGVPPLYLEIPSMWGQYANMVAVLLSRREKSSALWLF